MLRIGAGWSKVGSSGGQFWEAGGQVLEAGRQKWLGELRMPKNAGFWGRFLSDLGGHNSRSGGRRGVKIRVFHGLASFVGVWAVLWGIPRNPGFWGGYPDSWTRAGGRFFGPGADF